MGEVVSWSAAPNPRITADWVYDASRECPSHDALPVQVGAPLNVVVRVRVRLPEPRRLNEPAWPVRAWIERHGERLAPTHGQLAGFDEVVFGTLTIRVPEVVTAAAGLTTLKVEVRPPAGEPLFHAWQIYAIFDRPSAPWIPDGYLCRPWMRALEWAIRWVDGARTPEEALSALQKKMWTGLRPARAGAFELRFLGRVQDADRTWTLLQFLEALDGEPTRVAWGCEDCAAFVAFFASILGIPCTLGTVRRAGARDSMLRVSPHVRLGSPDAEPVFQEYEHHRVVLRDGNVWDPAFRFVVDGLPRPTEGVPRCDYLARFATRGTRPTTILEESGLPIWGFSEVLPMYLESGESRVAGGRKRLPDPRRLVAAWFGLPADSPRINIAAGAAPAAEVTGRSLHVAVVSADDRSMMRLDLFDYSMPAPTEADTAQPGEGDLVAGARARQLHSLCTGFLGEETVELPLATGRMVVSRDAPTDALLVDAGGYIALLRSTGPPMLPQDPAATALKLRAEHEVVPEALLLAEGERDRAPLRAFAALVSRLVVAKGLDRKLDPAEFFAPP